MREKIWLNKLKKMYIRENISSVIDENSVYSIDKIRPIKYNIDKEL